MSEQKTEEPTPKKLRDARKDGQVAKSKDIPLLATFVGVMSVMLFGFGPSFGRYRSLFDKVMAQAPSDVPGERALQVFSDVPMTIVAIMAPILLVAAITGTCAHYFQIGGIFSAKAVAPDIKKLSPLKKIKEVVSIQNFASFLMSTAKVLVIGALVIVLFRTYLTDMGNLMERGPTALLGLGARLMLIFSAVVAVAYTCFAVVDFSLEKIKYKKKLMMSKSEVKREYKQSEGSPEIKQRRKELHKEILDSAPIEDTKKADVLVANPIHFAVGLQYDPTGNTLPKVVSKGMDQTAVKMQKVAIDEKIPIMRNVPLARELHHRLDNNQYVPDDMFETVASVFKWVEEQKPVLDRRIKDKDEA